MQGTNIINASPCIAAFSFLSLLFLCNINCLLTKRKGLTGEYWRKVVTENDRGYLPVRLEKARLVSSLLYGTLFLIIKCTSDGLHLKMFIFFIHLWNFGKISIFSASSGSFNMKNDNIHTFFCCFGCKFWISRLCSQTKIHGLDCFHGNGPYCKILTEKEPIRAQEFA